MPTISQRITPFLWFDDQAEAAVDHYVSVFDHARIVSTTRYGAEAARASGRPVGSVMTLAFELAGQSFTALNGGPAIAIGPGVSFVVNCADQDEIDHYWEQLGAGGDPAFQQCGWLRDRFGVSWQVVPSVLPALLDDPARGPRVMAALLGMKKLDIDALARA